MHEIERNWIRRDASLAVGGREEKHEIYVAKFSGYLFYDLFLQGGGDMPSSPPASATA